MDRTANAMRIAGAASVIVGLLLASTSPRAEVLKLVRMCSGQQLCPYYELVLKPPEKWFMDKEASKQNGVQMMLPQGKNFGNADAVMYVKVSLREKGQDLADFIRVSQERWKQAVSDAKISKIADVERANGMPAFISYRYENPSRPQQRFEAVSFAHDKDKDGNEFVLMVALTGMQKKAIDQAMTPYNAFLKTH